MRACFVLHFFLGKELILDAPELFGKVYIILVRILKTLDLVPESIYLCGAVCAYILIAWFIVNKLAVFEYGNKKFLCGEVPDSLFLPGICRIKDLKITAVVYRFIIDGKLIGNSLARLLIIKPVELFKIRSGDLGHIFGYLDLRCDTAVVFNCGQLIDPAENGSRL